MAHPNIHNKQSEQRFIKEKNTVANAVLSSNDITLIQIMKTILSEYKKISKKKISVKKYNEEIENAEKRIKQGKFTSHAKVVKEMKEW